MLRYRDYAIILLENGIFRKFVMSPTCQMLSSDEHSNLRDADIG
jgi:hypothetical protein